MILPPRKRRRGNRHLHPNRPIPRPPHITQIPSEPPPPHNPKAPVMNSHLMPRPSEEIQTRSPHQIPTHPIRRPPNRIPTAPPRSPKGCRHKRPSDNPHSPQTAPRRPSPKPNSPHPPTAKYRHKRSSNNRPPSPKGCPHKKPAHAPPAAKTTAPEIDTRDQSTPSADRHTSS